MGWEEEDQRVLDTLAHHFCLLPHFPFCPIFLLFSNPGYKMDLWKPYYSSTLGPLATCYWRSFPNKWEGQFKGSLSAWLFPNSNSKVYKFWPWHSEGSMGPQGKEGPQGYPQPQSSQYVDAEMFSVRIWNAFVFSACILNIDEGLVTNIFLL